VEDLLRFNIVSSERGEVRVGSRVRRMTFTGVLVGLLQYLGSVSISVQRFFIHALQPVIMAGVTAMISVILSDPWYVLIFVPVLLYGAYLLWAHWHSNEDDDDGSREDVIVPQPDNLSKTRILQPTIVHSPDHLNLPLHTPSAFANSSRMESSDLSQSPIQVSDDESKDSFEHLSIEVDSGDPTIHGRRNDLKSSLDSFDSHQGSDDISFHSINDSSLSDEISSSDVDRSDVSSLSSDDSAVVEPSKL
jgi:hypothetical protein